MRIIAGSMRGRSFETPEGRKTRPTTDRLRESLMSSIFSARGSFDGAVVLDAFAGSGALGLEALSRGAKQALFCERDAKAYRILERNLAIALPKTARSECLDVFASLPHDAGDPFDLLFFDPPYATDPHKVCALLKRLDEAGLVAKGALAVYEHATISTQAVDEAFGAVAWRCIKRKAHKTTTIDLLRKEDQ